MRRLENMAKYLHKILLGAVVMFGLAVPAYSLGLQADAVAVEVSATVEIKVTDGKLYVGNLPVADRLNIYSVLGVNVASIEVKAGTNEYAVNLPKGLYIVKVGSVVKKIAVR